MTLHDEQVDRWATLRDEMFENQTFLKARRDRQALRHTAIQEMNQLLGQYCSGAVDNAALRSVFQHKSATAWDSFGLNGFSGAMFLNMLVNNIPDQAELSEQLKSVLPAPTSLDEGYQQLSNFWSYLTGLLQAGAVPKRRLQPAHTPFFISAWWHVQNREEWPIYYVTARQALIAEGAYTQQPNPVEDYFVFREIFLQFAENLDLSLWDMENLYVWHSERTIHTAPPIEPDEATAIVAEPVEQTRGTKAASRDEERQHTQVQLMLARIGRAFGYKIWIAPNDRKAAWNGETLGNYSIESLPLFNGVGPKSQRMIELIDVVWLKGLQIAAAFEVESTTTIVTGLLRLSDLSLAIENAVFPLYIAAPNNQIEEVRGHLSKLTFQRLELHRRVRFFTFEKLFADAEAMIQYANDVRAIDKISQQVGDMSEEGL